MKKFAFLFLVFSSCIESPKKHDSIGVNPTQKAAMVAQVCIDSMYNAYLVNMSRAYPYHITKVVLEKSKYFDNDQKFHWGKHPVSYKFVPDSLKNKPYEYDTFSNIEMPYILKADSIAGYDLNKAYVRMLMTGIGSQIEFYLSHENNHWIIRKTIGMDYKE